MNVEWKVRGLFKADATKVYEEITALGDNVTAKEIVKYAENENSELHKCFTWDDAEASAKWREHEARKIVTLLVVKTQTTDNEPVNVRLIVNTGMNRGYEQTVKVIRSDTKYADYVARAFAELRAFKAKYENIVELRELFALIDEIAN